MTAPADAVELYLAAPCGGCGAPRVAIEFRGEVRLYAPAGAREFAARLRAAAPGFAELAAEIDRVALEAAPAGGAA